ncbi:MAG: phage scaffolding protein, partial [Dehalococcoidales bacterium]|nr:phage scaffolding protein [Dehalococcoidales bacterium]
GLQTKITELQAANTKAKEDYDKAIKQAQLESKLELRLIKEGAVNTKAVKSLLDTAKISLDGENLIGIDEQLKTLKETEKWAFGTPAAAKTGMEQGGGGGDKTLADEIKSQMFGAKT